MLYTMSPLIPLLALVFLTNHPLLLSAGDSKPLCPETSFFKCGKLSNLQYPFTSSSYPKCGLFSVSGCNQTIQKIHLGKRWYEIELISQSGSVLINDPNLKTLLSSRNCQYFDEMTHLSLSSFPFVSLEILENRTVFKCDRTVRVGGGEGLVSVGCGGYVFYYGGGGLEGRCSAVRVPVNGSVRGGGGLFGMLSGEFYVQASVSLECWKCVDGGGRCESDGKGRLRCTTVKENEGLGLHSKLLILAAGIGTLIAILVLLLRVRHTISISLSFWKRERGEDDKKIESMLRACGPLCQKRYSYLEIKKMTESFKDKLGEGGFGGVYKGKLQNGHLVAIKVLKGSKGNGEEFINEVSSISKTSHVNIVSLLGFCFEGQRRALVYEFMANGSLEKFIYEESSVIVNRVLEWETLFKIAVGIARGLEYLHLGCNTRILHFDIKPHNILLDEEFCPKISDFGLAKICPRKESIISMVGARGTAGYIAPEVVCRNIGGVSHKSDVYSYGMMVLEMVGGRRNIDCEAENTSEIYFPHWIYNRVVSEKGLGLGLGLGRVGLGEEEEDSVRKMVVVSLWCVQTEPSKRPSMSRVVDMLEGRVGTLPLEHPPNPFY